MRVYQGVENRATSRRDPSLRSSMASSPRRQTALDRGCFQQITQWCILFAAMKGSRMSSLSPDAEAPKELLLSVLYRYFFFGWLLHDVSHARNPFERNAALRHNREVSRWLPMYMLRWAILSAVMFALGSVSETVFAAPHLAAWLYIAFCLCVPMLAITFSVWVLLRQAGSV
jgi:hypothetical protein